MTFVGVVQTGDIDEALECAQDHVSKGEHILVMRYEYPVSVGEVRHSLDHCHPLEHEPIEYEVWVDMN